MEITITLEELRQMVIDYIGAGSECAAVPEHQQRELRAALADVETGSPERVIEIVQMFGLLG